MRDLLVRIEDAEVVRRQSHQDNAVGHRTRFLRKVVVAASATLITDESRFYNIDAVTEEFGARGRIDQRAGCEQSPRRDHDRTLIRIAVPIFVAYASAQH